MAYILSNLQTDIRNYTEVDANVLTAAVINGFLRNAEHRINLAVSYTHLTLPTKA